tara:strand:- start:6917 stop:9034 length:2118 start_codon:yes stop_codon:yes gene_type:complete
MMKKITFFIVMISFHLDVFSYNTNPEEMSRLVLFLGRFHPLIVHLPIGALIITFYLDIIGRIRKNYQRKMIEHALGFSSVFSILACVLGYFISLEGGYDTDHLDTHFWTGISAASLITILFVIRKSSHKKSNKIFLPFFVLTLIGLCVAGHFGSVLTHGDNFITEYASALPKQKLITQVDSLQFYNDVIHKILDDKCIQCHNSTKKKGELSLSSKEMLLKGGKNGKIAHINDAISSSIYTNALLPLEDDLHMPPEGKPQLTKHELWLINYWINNGLDFESNIIQIKSNDTLNTLLKKYLIFEKSTIPFADQSDILKLQNAKFNVYRLVPNKPELSVKYLGSNLQIKDFKLLLNIKKQIVELDLSNSNTTDEKTNILAKLKNLQKIRLDNTLITDTTLKHLADLSALKSLNIHNTMITNTGLEQLLSTVTPQNIYSWNTKVETDFAKTLELKHKVTISNGVFEGFIEKVALRAPTLMTKKTLFEDTISVRLQTKMKDVTIRYTLNSNEPDVNSPIYLQPIVLKENTTVKYKAYKKDWYPSLTFTKDFVKAAIKINNYTILEEPDTRYPRSSKLFDFEKGTINFKGGKWTGFNGNDIVVVIDMEVQTTVEKVSVSCLEQFKDYILFPKKLVIYSAITKAAKFKKLGELKINSLGVGSVGILKRFTLDFPKTKAQYFKLIVENHGPLPASHPAAGEKSWLFVDEITIQ